MTEPLGETENDRVIADTIGELLSARVASSSICPSEVARALASGENAWRALMPIVRRVAAKMASEGKLKVTRGADIVDAESEGGPIRLRRPR
ncbi:DUF3253 domain-containing protein [Variovorax sp. RHLX14]|uniref:DUF3253 domain-containing protein n=1 Tax=Variovorax sp. RHLX14 TaxID=1259731 RepID=UPI003F473B12